MAQTAEVLAGAIAGAATERAQPPRALPPGDQRAPLPSLRLLITLIVVVPIVVVSAALILIATITTRSIAEELGHEIVSSATLQVSNDVRDYLGSAMRVSDLYQRRIKD